MSKNFYQKTVKYHKHYQKFSEVDMDGNTNYGCFLIHEDEAKIIVSNNVVVVILSDGSKGIAKCGKNDTFSMNKGLKIAYTRAKIISLGNDLECLIK